MKRSFRLQLAIRYAVAIAAGATLVATIGYLTLRATLDRQIDASLLAVASIQAASVTEDPDGEMRFYEWDLTPEEIASLRELNRYAQIWDEHGRSLNRSRLLVKDLPLDPAALGLALEGEVAWARAPWEDGEIRSVFYPLARLGATHAEHILQVAAPLGWRNRTLRSAGLFFFVVVVLVTSTSLAGGWWLAGRAVRAVGEITAQAEVIGAATLGRRITAHEETREYARLVGVLNRMLERIDSAFEAQRRFTADASHELRSPLTALRGELELAGRRDRSPEEYRRVIESALEETARLTRLVEDLLTLARSDAGAMQPRREATDVTVRAEAALERLRPVAEAKGLRLEVTGSGDTTALADPELLDRLVWNLLDNAVKFSDPGGSVEIRATGAAEAIELTVSDTGRGIPEETAPLLFERFSRTDAAHTSPEGTGLGLAIVKAIAEAHGGRVRARNRPAGGAEFVVTLPRG